MAIKIRRMRESDCTAVARMNDLLMERPVSNGKKNAAVFKKFCFGAKRLATVWVATVNDKPIGFIATRDWVSFGAGAKVRQIDLLFVHEKHRGQGISSKLINHAIADGRKTGCKRIDIQALKKNKAPNKLYPRLSFDRFSPSIHHYRRFV